MKKYLCVLSVILISTSAVFADLPKINFTRETNTSQALRIGNSETQFSGKQNAVDVKPPTVAQKRGFKAYTKVDCFGDPLGQDFQMYRQLLTDEEKLFYDEFYTGLMNKQKKISFVSRVNKESMNRAVEAVYYDNPEIYFYYRCSNDNVYWSNSDGMVTDYAPAYFFNTEEEIQKAEQEFFEKSMPIIFYANLLDNDIDKVKYIHDYICLSTVYDDEAYAAKNTGGIQQSAYSCIVNYVTVCAGYSRAFAYYMQMLDIPCIILHSNGHAWNMVKINGEYYQMDITWNDGSQIPKYYNLTHADMGKIEYHTPISLSVDLINKCSKTSNKCTYSNTFGNIPVGSPYTYQEFARIYDDIENPRWAKVDLDN